jgi:HPt (histidine-containing phosphotransfer) domain-containing protein
MNTTQGIGDYAAYLPDIDLKDGIGRVMNKESIYLRLLGKFKPREMVEDLIAKINAASDMDAIRNAAHALKGSAANLGMPVIVQATQLIEEDAKKGRPGAEHVGALFSALEALEAKIAMLLNH